MTATTQTIDAMIDVLRRRHFIIPDREDLLIISEHERGDVAQTRYLSRHFGSDVFAFNPSIMEQAWGIAEYAEEHDVRFFRYDCEENKVCEDVTDEIATAYIERLTHDDFENMCEEDLPPFARAHGTYWNEMKDLAQEEHDRDEAEWSRGPAHYYGVPAR